MGCNSALYEDIENVEGIIIVNIDESTVTGRPEDAVSLPSGAVADFCTKVSLSDIA